MREPGQMFFIFQNMVDSYYHINVKYCQIGEERIGDVRIFIQTEK